MSTWNFGNSAHVVAGSFLEGTRGAVAMQLANPLPAPVLGILL